MMILPESLAFYSAALQHRSRTPHYVPPTASTSTCQKPITTDNSQPSIFRFDTTAGQFDSDDSYYNQFDSDDDSDDDFSEAFSDDVYSFKQLMQVEKSAFSSFLPHDFYDDDDDDSTDSKFDYFQQEGDATKRIDSYDFVHDTDPYTPMDIYYNIIICSLKIFR